MPRGVYNRDHLKNKKAAPTTQPTTKKNNSPAKAQTKTASAPKLTDLGTGVAPVNKVMESMLSFNILGANINTLSEAYGRIVGDSGPYTAAQSSLCALIAAELRETVKTMTRLREDVYRDILPIDPVDHARVTQEVASGAELSPAVKEEAAESSGASETPAFETDPAVSAPLAAPPKLPQGNAGFTPPAPPALPRH